MLSDYPAPEKQEYIVRSGDVLARVAHKIKTTPELIMRTNNLNGTMLRIGQRLLISHPDFSLFIQRKAKRRLPARSRAVLQALPCAKVKLPGEAASENQHARRRNHGVEEWQTGRFGSRNIPSSTRWIRLAQPGYFIYSEPDDAHQTRRSRRLPRAFGLAASETWRN